MRELPSYLGEVIGEQLKYAIPDTLGWHFSYERGGTFSPIDPPAAYNLRWEDPEELFDIGKTVDAVLRFRKELRTETGVPIVVAVEKNDQTEKMHRKSYANALGQELARRHGLAVYVHARQNGEPNVNARVTMHKRTGEMIEFSGTYDPTTQKLKLRKSAA